MTITLAVVPPTTTAQMKRLHVGRDGRPHFFHSAKMKREEQTWAALLAPYAPPAPLLGAVSLRVQLIYPHPQSVSAKMRVRLVPKTTKPDCDNVSKHLIDLLTTLKFIEDDQRVARLLVEKYCGPTALVGIRIELDPLNLSPASEGVPTDD